MFGKRIINHALNKCVLKPAKVHNYVNTLRVLVIYKVIHALLGSSKITVDDDIDGSI